MCVPDLPNGYKLEVMLHLSVDTRTATRSCRTRGVSCTDFDSDDLIDTVDRKLFSHITDPNHCLYHLLPPRAHRSYNLRKRQHGYQLPQIEYNLYKNSFINRYLFNSR